MTWRVLATMTTSLSRRPCSKSTPTRSRASRTSPLLSPLCTPPFASFGGQDFYPDPIQRAGILCSRLVRNHPLPDGNKRTAYLSMLMFLDTNGIAWHPAQRHRAGARSRGPDRPDDDRGRVHRLAPRTHRRISGRPPSERDLAFVAGGRTAGSAEARARRAGRAQGRCPFRTAPAARSTSWVAARRRARGRRSPRPSRG